MPRLINLITCTLYQHLPISLPPTPVNIYSTLCLDEFGFFRVYI